jgi:hypothetical protein
VTEGRSEGGQRTEDGAAVERQAKQGEEGADVDACVDVLRNCGTWTQAWTMSHVNVKR